MATKNNVVGGEKVSHVIAREGNGNIQIMFTIPYDLVKKEKDEALSHLSKDVEVPGFRKGMAPVNLAAEKISQSTLIEHALSHILPEALSQALTQNKLKIAVYPKFELVSAEEGKPWQIRGVTCELPEVSLGDYKEKIKGSTRASALWTPDKGKPDEKKELSHEEKEQIVIKSLLENVKVAIPQILIEEEADSRLSSLLARLEKLGLALESYLASIGKKPEDIRAEYANQAREAITLDLILNKVVEMEKIKVEDKEVEAALNMSQATNGKDRSNEDPESRRKLIESILKRRAALDYLISLA